MIFLRLSFILKIQISNFYFLSIILLVVSGCQELQELQLYNQSNQLKERIVEVETTLNLSPNKNDLEKINTKIVYSTIIELNSEITDKKELEKIILINVPSEIYPEIRKIFIFVFENSGFKDIKISNNVDFQKLYNIKTTQ